MQTAPSRRGRLVGRLVGGLSELVCPAFGGAAASAVPWCDAAPARRRLREGLGVLEAATVDNRGRLYVSSQTWHGATRGAVLRLDDADAEPIDLTGPIPSPGGLAFTAEGTVIAGFGDSLQGGLLGGVRPRAGLLQIDPDAPPRSQELWVSGLGMANGVAAAADGAVYASNDFGTHIERIGADGRIDRRWARVWSANGLAIDPTGRYLYAAQSFTRAAVKRITIADPTDVATIASPEHAGGWPGVPDGLAVDAQGRVACAVNVAGQVWRVGPEGTLRALARGLRFPSSLAPGRGRTGFAAGNLYVVTFRGEVWELTDADRPG